jgi:hypothetical protein
MADTSPLSMVQNTLFAMLATYLFNGSRDIATVFPTIPRMSPGPETKTKYRTFQFEQSTYFCTQRGSRDYFIGPGVNMYFGDNVAIPRRVQPQIWKMPVMMHVMVPVGGDFAQDAYKISARIEELVQNAWEGIGSKFQVHDLTISPAAPMTGRFVTWAKSTRGSWTATDDPTKDDFTNRIWTIQVSYVR